MKSKYTLYDIYYSFISIRKKFDLIPNATSASNLQINLTDII